MVFRRPRRSVKGVDYCHDPKVSPEWAEDGQRYPILPLAYSPKMEGRQSNRVMKHIYLIRHDAKQNMHRFYQMIVAVGLLGGWWLIQEWGQVGSPSVRF